MLPSHVNETRLHTQAKCLKVVFIEHPHVLQRINKLYAIVCENGENIAIVLLNKFLDF